MRRRALAALLVAPALAQANPLRLVVGFAPGGGIDAYARLAARRLQEVTGRAVLVDNRAGAGGTIAAAHVARAAPDGLTLLVGENGSIATAGAVYANLPYDPLRDLVPVMLGVKQSVVVAARPGIADDLAGLAAAARAAPGRLAYSSAGAGNPTHLFPADFSHRAGIETTHVPYRGGGQMVASLLAGDTQFGFFGLASALPQIRNGNAVALAVGDEAPAPLLPQVPLASSTLPGFTFNFWYGFNAPTGTPAALVAELNAALAQAFAAPEVLAQLAAQGLRHQGGSPADYAAFAATETERWSAVARSAGVRPE